MPRPVRGVILLLALLLAGRGAPDRVAKPDPAASTATSATATSAVARPRDALRGDTPPEGSLPFEDPHWFHYAVPPGHPDHDGGMRWFRHESGYRTQGDGEDVHGFERYLKSTGLDLSITLMDWDDGASLSVSAGDFRSFPGNVDLEVAGGWLGVRKQRASRRTEIVQVDGVEGQMGRRGHFLLIRIEDQQSRAYACTKASLPGHPAADFADDAALVRFLTRHDTVIDIRRCDPHPIT